MISPQTDTCSSTSPAPGGKNACGPTVFPQVAQRFRQAGEFYRVNPVKRNRS
jgi:hypothetical protein